MSAPTGEFTAESTPPPDPAIARLLDAGAGEALARAVVDAASQCSRALAAHRDVLRDDDFRELVTAYYRAESLASFALEDAIEQSSGTHRTELIEQLEDEKRHIDVFAGWLTDDPPLQRPGRKERQPEVWYALLLVNEVTGYCQFRMLTALTTPEQTEQVEEVLLDEERHIGRLARWLAPVWGGRLGVIPERIVERFVRDLRGRMHQFFPREELAPVREAVADAISAAVEAVKTP